MKQPCIIEKRLTSLWRGDIISVNTETRIEVAFFMSRVTDVSGTEEIIRKGKMPKGQNA
jgi:hypothetical protein